MFFGEHWKDPPYSVCILVLIPALLGFVTRKTNNKSMKSCNLDVRTGATIFLLRLMHENASQKNNDINL
jgi:hypothetical protein